jgi:DUF1680 family protein
MGHDAVVRVARTKVDFSSEGTLVKPFKFFAALVLVSASLVAAVSAQSATALKQIAKPFTAHDVKLLDGPFLHAQQLDAQYLLSLDPDRLLSWFRKEAKLEPKAEVYGGWESRGIAGHSLGHYLSACARMYQATGDARFKDKADYVVDELKICQQADKDGYIGAIPRGREIFAEVSKGDIRSQGFDLNGGWVPWYTQHKVFAGLIDAHQYTDNADALAVALKFADWADGVTKDLNDEQWQRMLACEHGGMNEVLAELSFLSGDPKYMELAEKYYHKAILDPLSEQRDELSGKHSNTQIPKIIGAARIAELTDQSKFATIARFFWDTITSNHSYVTGGNSLGEHLGEPGKLNDRLGASTTETCNTYNMLKLTSALFADDPQARYTDYAERALWNHILASQSSQTGMVCYFVPLQAGGKKPFQDPEAFTCCTGSGMENHARYGEYIYARSDDTLWVNQFISSELNWEAKGVHVRQESQLPSDGKVKLEFTCDAPTKFMLKVRRPHWAKEFQVVLNGKGLAPSSEAGSYIDIDHTWQSGDVLELSMPETLRVESMPDNPNRVAVFYGPVLLAGILQSQAQELMPVLVTNQRPVDEWLKRVDGDSLEFKTDGVGRPRDQTLKPFHAIVDEPYVVYWDIFDDAGWEKLKKDYEAERERQRQLEASTVDLFQPGEMQQERDHKVEGESTGAGEFAGRKFRDAYQGGWFSCEIALPENAPADLVVTYWGSETGNRKFDLLLDGEKFASQSLHRDKPEKFWEKTYELPEAATKGKKSAVLKFQAEPGNFAGGVFGIRVVRRGQ